MLVLKSRSFLTKSSSLSSHSAILSQASFCAFLASPSALCIFTLYSTHLAKRTACSNVYSFMRICGGTLHFSDKNAIKLSNGASFPPHHLTFGTLNRVFRIFSSNFSIFSSHISKNSFFDIHSRIQ